MLCVRSSEVAVAAAASALALAVLRSQAIVRFTARVKATWEHWRETRRWHATDVQPAYVHSTRFDPSDAAGIQAHLKEHG